LKKLSVKYLFVFIFAACGCGSGNINTIISQTKILPPDYGVYVGAFPDMGSTEDTVSYSRIKAFENLSGKKPAWVYFSNNWYNGIKFPKKEAEIIRDFGSVPFIRLMPRSDYTENAPDRTFTLQKISDGYFDRELTSWANDAKDFGGALMLEFGTEVNGKWFPWCGINNGSNPDLFKKAYIHIIEIFRNSNTNNITWVYHVNYDSEPDEQWNSMSAYYPGDEYIDWIGMSIYGSQGPGDDWTDISEIFGNAYENLSKISTSKPLAVLEFGVNEDKRKPEWIKNFFGLIKNQKYSRIKGISCWHSRWENNDGSVTNMRLDSSPESLETYKKIISDNFFLEKIKTKD
jgi:hypothetical protein